MPNSAATPDSARRLTRLHSGVAEYERRIGPIAARRTTRTAALHAFTRAFWWYVWPALRTESVWGFAFGIVPVRVPLRTLHPTFTGLFGPDAPPPHP